MRIDSVLVLVASTIVSSMIFGCVAASQKSATQKSPPRTPAMQDFGGFGDPANWSTPMVDQGDPRFDALVGILRSGPANLNGFLKLVGDQFPNYFRYHTVAYRSGSLHETSYENPRAIVFGSTGNIIITFNGDPKLDGYSYIEMSEFDRKTGYKFREIQFIKDIQPGHDKVMDVAFVDPDLSTKNIRVSKPNPFKCMGCHAQSNTGFSNLRKNFRKLALPIWEPYFVWPGIYGSDDDNVYRGGPSLAKAFRLVGDDIEAKGYALYQARKLQTDPGNRYRNLPEPQGIAPPEAEKDYLSDFHRPNSSLNKVFLYQTGLLAMREVAQKPDGLKKVAEVGRLRCTHYVDFKLEDYQREGYRLQPMVTRLEQINLAALAKDFATLPPVNAHYLGAGATAFNMLALRSVGVDLESYAFSATRVPIFADGGRDLELTQAAAQVLTDLVGLDRPVTCEDFKR